MTGQETRLKYFCPWIQISSSIRWNYHIQDFALRGRYFITLLGAMTKTENFSRVIPGGDSKVKVKNRFIKTSLLLCSYLIHLPFVQLLVCLLFAVRRKGETLLPEDIASSSMHRNKCQFKSLSGVPNIQYSQENPQNLFQTKKKQKTKPKKPCSTVFFLYAHTHKGTETFVCLGVWARVLVERYPPKHKIRKTSSCMFSHFYTLMNLYHTIM